jgi:TRAP-type transport system periplasmic protein
MTTVVRALTRRAWMFCCAALVLALALLPARAEGPIVVKLATLAPEGTSWYAALREMGDRWSAISGGQVTLKIYAGGVAGNEGAVVRKMRIGQLHAAALTNLGILDIDQGPEVLSTPMLFRDYPELDYVMGRMVPVFESRLARKDYVALNWSEAGWAYLFTKTPVRTPADIKNVKIYAFEGDANAVNVMRQAGFNPVVIASVDMVPSLQSGLVEAFHATPLMALSFQWFGLAKNMLDIPWAPVVGGTIMTRAMWDQIPAQYHDRFLQAARETGQGLKAEIRAQDKKAISVMQKYGLQVIGVDAATRAEWEKMATGMYPTIRSTVVPSDVYDATVTAVNAYRSGAR